MSRSRNLALQWFTHTLNKLQAVHRALRVARPAHRREKLPRGEGLAGAADRFEAGFEIKPDLWLWAGGRNSNNLQGAVSTWVT